MNKKIYIIPFILCISVFFFSSCEEKKFTPTKGEANAAADESLFRVTEAAKNEFEKMYVNAKVNLSKLTAREAIPQLFDGKIQLFVCGRGLNEEELDYVIAVVRSFYNK